MRIIGVVLTGVFYTAIVSLAVLLLATVQLRSSGGAAFDTWKLNYEANEQLAVETRAELKSNQVESRKNLEQLLYVRNCLHLFDKYGIPQAKLIDTELRQEVQKAREDRVPLERLSGNVHCLARGFNDLNYDEAFYSLNDESFSRENDELTKALDSNREEHAELIKGHQDFIAFKKMASVWYQRPFFDITYDLLVLFLVMTMGAIGGIVRLLRDYGSSAHPNPSAKDYLIIPLIGAVVAIGGYILAKTGLLLLSSTKEETSLSPYMISLVGIVSGLLAKEVIERIAESGRTILQQNDPGIHHDADA
jgi:hypothetical protein